MKIFNKQEQWATKVNFVDENNVVLGYDTDQCCCESAGWYISDVKEPSAHGINTEPHVIENESEWRFDLDFFSQTSVVTLCTLAPSNPLDAGEVATFRIVNGEAEKFLHLFNCHNGYYGHGFNFTVAGKESRTGTL